MLLPLELNTTEKGFEGGIFSSLVELVVGDFKLAVVLPAADLLELLTCTNGP